MNGGLRRQELPSCIVQIFFGEGIQGNERPDPVKVGSGGSMSGLAGVECRFGFIDLNLKRAWIDLEKRLSISDCFCRKPLTRALMFT